MVDTAILLCSKVKIILFSSPFFCDGFTWKKIMTGFLTAADNPDVESGQTEQAREVPLYLLWQKSILHYLNCTSHRSRSNPGGGSHHSLWKLLQIQPAQLWTDFQKKENSSTIKLIVHSDAVKCATTHVPDSKGKKHFMSNSSRRLLYAL